MKFFHLSDLHLGIRLRDYSLRDDQVHILNQIVAAAEKEKPDAILIAGDVFDKSDPGPEAVAMYSDFITALHDTVPGAAIIVVSGNHDNGERINLYRDVVREAGVHVAGRVSLSAPEKITLEDEDGHVHFYLLPYVRPGAARRPGDEAAPSYADAVHRLIAGVDLDPAARNVLVSHQFYVPAGQKPEDVERSESEVVRVGNLDAVPGDVLDDFDYAALGHIHRPMQVSKKALYCGTPLAYSLSERDQQKSIVMVDLPAGGPAEITRLPLSPLHRVRRIEGTLDEVTAQACGDYVEVILNGEKNTDYQTIRSRLRDAFPRLLNSMHAADGAETGEERIVLDHREIDPMQLCLDFLGDEADEENRRILTEILAELEVN